MIPKYKIILTIVFVVHYLIFSILAILMYGIVWNVKEDSTTEYTATISVMQFEDTIDSQKVTIFTQEYSCFFTITLPDDCSVETVKAAKALQSGDKIRFRIHNRMQTFLHSSSFVEILSLETESCSIVSFEDHTAALREASKEDRIKAAIVPGSLLIASVAFGLSIIKDRKRAKASP